jgi:signal transduction protein with GAF and PtsI domain
MTSEFEQFLKASALGNRDAVEALFDQVLAAVGEKVRLLLNADRCTIFVVDHEHGKLRSKIATDELGKPMTIEIPIDAGIAGMVARTGEVANIPDPYGHPQFNMQVDIDTGYRTRGILCMPILDRKKKIFAVAQVINRLDWKPFDAQDEKTFAEFAELFSLVVESCQQMQSHNTNLAA